MIESKTRQIMLGGIKKYAEESNLKPEMVQIHVTHGENEELVYKMCQNWQPKKIVDFKYILNKKLDLLGLEMMATPVLKQSLDFYITQYNITSQDASVFIFCEGKNIGVAVFNKTDNILAVSLKDHLTKIGILG